MGFEDRVLILLGPGWRDIVDCFLAVDFTPLDGQPKKHQWIHTKQCYQALRELQDTVPEVSALWKTHEAMVFFRIRRHCGDLWMSITSTSTFHRGAAIHCHRSPAVSCWILRITQWSKRWCDVGSIDEKHESKSQKQLNSRRMNRNYE